jgi:hypothetical protein
VIPTIEVLCRDCDDHFRISDIAKEGLLKAGLLKREERPVPGQTYGIWEWVGRCIDCARAQASKPRRRGTVEQEAAYYQRLIHINREAHPEWSLKRCAKEASAEVHDPRREPDHDFRAYLTGDRPKSVKSADQVTPAEIKEVHRLLRADLSLADLTKPHSSPFDGLEQSTA